jgi:hypothetical protein
MSLIDKASAAITPPESDEACAKASAKVESAAIPGSWYAQILDHRVTERYGEEFARYSQAETV